MDLHIYHSSLPTEIHLRRDLSTTIASLTQHVADLMNLSDAYHHGCIRLRRYVPEISWMGTSWAGELTLEEAGMGKKNCLYVETRREDQEWIPFNPK